MAMQASGKAATFPHALVVIRGPSGAGISSERARGGQGGGGQNRGVMRAEGRLSPGGGRIARRTISKPPYQA